MAECDPFARLPGPVLVSILISLENLASVFQISRASPTVYSLLHESGTGVMIIEKIMALAIPDQTQILIRKFARLRAGSHPVSTVDEFIEQYIKSDKGFEHLARDLPTSQVFHILIAAATIHHLAHVGMHEMIERCMGLKLLRMAHPKKKYMSNAHRTPSMWESEYYPVPKPEREPYQQIDVGSPSKIEEQRAIRALWQLFLVWELHDATYGPKPRWRWPLIEIKKLQRLNIDEIWSHALWNEILEQIRTMMSCTCLYPEIKRAVERYSVTKLHAMKANYHLLCDCSPARPVKWEKLSPGGCYRADNNKTLAFKCGAPGYGFVLGSLTAWYTSPARYVEFRPYRKYGFAIWDRKRMAGLGLLEPRPSAWSALSPQSEADQYVRWESILTAEDLEEIERKRKHFWPGTEYVRVENTISMDVIRIP